MHCLPISDAFLVEFALLPDHRMPESLLALAQTFSDLEFF